MERIETGIDQFLHLLNEKKEISIEDAAKLLGIGRFVVKEWAEFLEEEGIVEISHKFSHDIVKLKGKVKNLAKKKKNELILQRDSFLSRIDNLITTISREAEGLMEAKKKMSEVETEIKSKIGAFTKDLEKLDELEKRRRILMEKIKEMESVYKKEIASVKHKIEQDQKMFDELITNAQAERKKLMDDESRVNALDEELKILQKNIEKMSESLKKMSQGIHKMDSKISVQRSMINRLELHASKIESLTKAHKAKLLRDLKERYEDITKKISLYQEKLLKNISMIDKSLDSEKKKGESSIAVFERFIKKKRDIFDLIEKLDKEIDLMKQELLQMKRKALAIDVFSKKSSQDEIEKLEKHLESLEREKKKLENELLVKEKSLIS